MSSKLIVNSIENTTGTHTINLDSGNSSIVGDLTVGGDLTATGVTMTGDFLPSADNTSDLGSTAKRYQDAYLSGGVYLGGTGSANHLDDYEEGTWTPSMDGMGSATFSQQYGRYTKVGNVVHVTGKIAWTGANGTAQVYISGLPFASVDPSDTQQRNSAWPQGDYQNINTLIDRYGHFRTDGSRLFGVIDDTSGYTIGMSCTTHVSSSGEFNFNVTYRTT